jgi:hypothetical protein
LKEVPGGGEPNPKPLHSRGNFEHHINDLQERDGFRHSVKILDKGEHTKGENQRRVLPSLSRNAGEQREEAEPFQPNPAEQQDAERLVKPPPRSGEQEIAALLPAYFDWDDRQRVSMRFDPDRKPGRDYGDRLPEFHGWDNLAEVLLDFSGFLSKPEYPSLQPDDYEGRLRTYRMAMLLGACGWEAETIRNLTIEGREYLIPQFKQDMQEYRDAVKGIVAVWRKRGLV